MQNSMNLSLTILISISIRLIDFVSEVEIGQPTDNPEGKSIAVRLQSLILTLDHLTVGVKYTNRMHLMPITITFAFCAVTYYFIHQNQISLDGSRICILYSSWQEVRLNEEGS